MTGAIKEVRVSEKERAGRYDPAEIEPRWQAQWDADASLYAVDDLSSGKPKFYCLEMLPYPSGQLHIGPRAQLRDRRCAGALHVDARAQCAAPDGVGCLWAAGGECGDQEQHAAAGVDACQYSGDAQADAAARAEL